jgi:hypothetical protein
MKVAHMRNQSRLYLRAPLDSPYTVIGNLFARIHAKVLIPFYDAESLPDVAMNGMASRREVKIAAPSRTGNSSFISVHVSPELLLPESRFPSLNVVVSMDILRGF